MTEPSPLAVPAGEWNNSLLATCERLQNTCGLSCTGAVGFTSPTDIVDVACAAHHARLLLAKRLAAIELHRVDFVTDHDTSLSLVHKRRTRHSRWAIAVGNVYLRIQQAGVQVLPESQWIAWEKTIAQANGGDSLNCRRVLVCPRLPGRLLSEVLSDVDLPLADKQACLGWALKSLLELHSQSADWGGGQQLPLSHGDATTENVMVDTVTRSARWFDYDMRHDIRLSPTWRQADDLRALIFSAAAKLSPADYLAMLSPISAALGDRPQVAEQMRAQLASRWRRANTFQLAQAPLGFRDHLRMCDLLLGVLR